MIKLKTDFKNGGVEVAPLVVPWWWHAVWWRSDGFIMALSWRHGGGVKKKKIRFTETKQ